MKDRFTDAELTELLTRVVAAIRGVPLDDPGVAESVDAVLQGRPGRY